jgi:AcrR family transcriptional regulator
MATRRNTRSLTVEQIVDVAVDLLETDGLGAVTIRGVAERLGVGAMTLYTYVGTKEGMLAAVASRYLASLELPPAELPWRERVAGTIRAVHELFIDIPELASIAASQPLDNVGAFRGAEIVLASLSEAGLSDQQAIDAFDVLASYVVGATLREVSRLTNYVAPAERMRELRRLPEGEFAHVRSMAEPFVARTTASGFDRGLDLLIEGIALQTANAGAAAAAPS